jgi:hypothetical protein
VNAEIDDAARSVSQAAACATVFTAAFVIGLGTAFAIGLWSRASALPPPVPIETASVAPDLALAGLPDAAPPADAGIQLASLETGAPRSLPSRARPRLHQRRDRARRDARLRARSARHPAAHGPPDHRELAKQFDFRRAQPGHAYRVTQDAEGA